MRGNREIRRGCPADDVHLKGVLDDGGINALRAMGGKGRPAQLDERQLEALRHSLLDNTTEHGLGTELWHSSGCVSSSSGYSVCRTAKCMSGASWGRRDSATRKPGAAPSSGMGLRLKYSSAKTGQTSHTGAYLGAQGANPCYSVSLQLETSVGYCRTRQDELPVPFPRRQHQERADRRVPQGAQGPSKQPLLIWDGLKAHRSRLVRDHLDGTADISRSPSCHLMRPT